jgi:cell division protein FtsI/penicillin-binding protein 2
MSSNYYFARLAWWLGNHTNGRTQDGIAILNYYMMALGLGSPTGVEVREAPMLIGANQDIPAVAGPAFRTARGEPGAWTDGNTAHVSIGQGFNQYTPTSMAKVMSTLATGNRMRMTLVDRRVMADGTIITQDPIIEYVLDVDPEHLNVIHQGMLAVTTAPRGTGTGIFRGFPIQVGIKSGTAEVAGGESHSSYGGFAPFHEPQIAAYVMIPHGDSLFLRASAGHVMRAVLEEYFGFNQDPYLSQVGQIR